MKTKTADPAQVPLEEFHALPKAHELAVVEREPTPANLIALALQQNIDPDKLTKLFDLHERNERMKAIIAYNVAMNKAQGEIPEVVADTLNKQTNSYYPSNESLNRVIKPVVAPAENIPERGVSQIAVSIVEAENGSPSQTISRRDLARQHNRFDGLPL